MLTAGFDIQATRLGRVLGSCTFRGVKRGVWIYGVCIRPVPFVVSMVRVQDV
jgi:hypothetical protein